MPQRPPPELLRTVHVIPLTPFDATGDRVALDVFEQHVAWLVDAGVQVLICGAGTGEFYALRTEELAALVRSAAGIAGERCLVWGAIGLGLPHALGGGEAILAAGGQGVMVMPPTGPYLSDAGLRDYYRAILAALDCPTAIYVRAALPGLGLLQELCDDPRVVAVKYATDDLFALARATASCRAVEWICGNAERWAPFYRLAGATGFTSGAANVAPRLSLRLQAALTEGDFPTAMRIRAAFAPLEDFRARDGASYNIVALKHAVRHHGRDFGPARPPMRRLTAEEELEVEAICRELLAVEEQECA